MTSLRRSERRLNKRKPSSAYRPRLELECLEARIVLSYADNNGAVVLSVTELNNGSALVVTFDGPLNANPSNPVESPTNPANYSIEVPSSNPEVVTSSLSSVSVSSASYNSSANQVTLNLGAALTQGQSYRLFVNGVANTVNPTAAGLIDASQNPIDGDYDDTASGDFYALFAWTTAGTPINYTDSQGDAVTLTLTGPGQLSALARARRRLQRRGPRGAGEPHRRSGPAVERHQRLGGRNHAVRLGIVRRREQWCDRHSARNPGHLHQRPPVVFPGHGPRGNTADPRRGHRQQPAVHDPDSTG